VCVCQKFSLVVRREVTQGNVPCPSPTGVRRARGRPTARHGTLVLFHHYGSIPTEKPLLIRLVAVVCCRAGEASAVEPLAVQGTGDGGAASQQK
jgi:hypothetical protein